MTIENACERFKKAVGILVDEKDRIKERLLVAYASQLSGVNHHRDLPESLVDEFERIRYALSDAEMPYGYGERAFRRVQEMSETEASEIARSIFNIFLALYDLKPEAAAG